METAMIILIVLQIISECFICYGLGYSKCKLPKLLLYADIGLLIFNFILIIRNLNRLLELGC